MTLSLRKTAKLDGSIRQNRPPEFISEDPESGLLAHLMVRKRLFFSIHNELANSARPHCGSEDFA